MEDLPRLVSTGDCVKIWDAVAMAPLEQFNPHSNSHPLAQACWSSNNQYLVSSSSSGDKLVVSSLKSSPVPVVELAEGKKQTRVCLSWSSQFVVSGGLDHCVHVWDLKTKRLHRTLKDHQEEVTCVSFNTNDSVIASGSTSGDLVLHSLTTNVSSKPFGHGTNQPVHDLRLSPLRRSVLGSVSDSGSLVLWDSNTQRELSVFEPVHDLRLSPLRRSLLGSVSDSGSLVLWDSNTQRELSVFEAAHKAPGSGLSFSPASELLLVSVGLDKKIVCYDTASKIILRSIRVDSPLTSVDFAPDGTGLVVGSTQGKIYHYDLRNSSAPTRVTQAHKTSVTCLRYHSNTSRLKSSKLGSTKIASVKRSSKQPPDSSPAFTRQASSGGAAADQQTDPLPVVEKFTGRNSLDVFSPAREDSRTQGTTGDSAFGRTHVSSLERLSREAASPQVVGRASLDIFSPVRDDSHSGGSTHRKTPLGTPLSGAARCYSPLSTFQTPPITEEELVPTASATGTEPCDSNKSDKASSSSVEVGETPPTVRQLTNPGQSAPFFTPEPMRRTNQIQAQLDYDSPLQGATATAAGASMSAAVSSSLSQNIVDVVAQSGAAPLTSLQIHFIQNMIHETLEDFRDTCHRDIVNLQVEMVRQFYIQLNEIHGLIEKYSVNESLVEEIEKLKEENKRLKTNY